MIAAPHCGSDDEIVMPSVVNTPDWSFSRNVERATSYTPSTPSESRLAGTRSHLTVPSDAFSLNE